MCYVCKILAPIWFWQLISLTYTSKSINFSYRTYLGIHFPDVFSSDRFTLRNRINGFIHHVKHVSCIHHKQLMHTYIFTLKLYYLSLSSLHTYVWLTVYRSDGFELAKLGPDSLDILVDKETDEKLMKDDMTNLNPSFLKMFPLTIQKGTSIKQKQEDF